MREFQWDPKVVFRFVSGSWFSDHDQPGNFLRAPLASKAYCLTHAWSATPLYFIHHMALGETIGGAAFLSHDQVTDPDTGYAHFFGFLLQDISSWLQGEPTLRLPPGDARVVEVDGSVTLRWHASGDQIEGLSGTAPPIRSGPAAPFRQISPPEIASLNRLPTRPRPTLWWVPSSSSHSQRNLLQLQPGRLWDGCVYSVTFRWKSSVAVR